MEKSIRRYNLDKIAVLKELLERPISKMILKSFL